MTDPDAALAQHWGLVDARVSPLGGGRNSETWLVEHEGSTYVAKVVPGDAVTALESGAAAATALADAGFVTGRPVPTRSGSLVQAELGRPGRHCTPTPSRLPSSTTTAAG